MAKVLPTLARRPPPPRRISFSRPTPPAIRRPLGQAAALVRDAARLAGQELKERVGTREITARLRTGITGRRQVVSDIELEFQMQPMVSALSGGTSSRIQLAGYNADAEVVRVVFRDGTPWEYFGVTPGEWDSFRTAPSPGRAVKMLEEHPHGRGNF